MAKTMKRAFILLMALAGGLAAPSQAQERWNELDFPELKAFNKPNVTTFTLKNGIKVYMLEDHELPVITMSALVRTGGLLETPDQYGLAGITGSVMRSGGSAKYPADVLNTMLEDKAAYISTSIGFSSGSAGLNTLKEDFATLLPVFVDVITNPAFPDDKIELSKRQSKTNISRRNDDPQAVASREFNRLIYGGESIYAKRTEYETVDNISRDDLIAFHRKSFVGSNMMVSVIGDFKTAEMRKLIEQHMSGIPKGTPLNLTYPPADKTNQATINLVDKKDSQQSVVFMGHKGGMRQDPDYAALQVMNHVLSGGTFSNRLMRKVRTDLGLAYAVFGDYGSNLNYNGTFYAGVMTKTETTSQAIDAIKGEIVRLQEEPVSAEELKGVKDQVLNSLVFRYTSLASVLGEQVSNEYNGLPADMFDKYIEEVKAVTPADIQRAANKHLRPDEMEILVVGSKAGIGTQLDKYGKVNEIDITIPQPKAEPKPETTGDAVGQEWLDKMADAVVAPGTNMRGVEAKGQVSQGPMSMDAVTRLIFPNEAKVDITSPAGIVQLSYKDGVALLRVGEQDQNLGEAGAEEQQINLDTHYIGVALKKGTLKASFAGTETVDGVEYAKITVNAGPGVTFWIHPQTNLPARMSMKRFVPQMGSETEIVTFYSNWNTKEGVSFAFGTEQKMGGTPTGGATFTSFEVIR